ncbi:Nucleotide-binding universal stress protein, UspA family [Amycolatopsis tolypomycina]|uniref:Nucleotide-binding universal stress protein, UspA family n=1 Tax=Amycolatopsis tolypomycina TaxID=208445 RepID=A0A1H4U970_9PSEU|nr:universal stress protein [Amycolatopsis tolypomycina]SEC64851.1 Nucleotide-binding universal stress protein, UspA family [Amycolatopsis tolypomycina]
MTATMPVLAGVDASASSLAAVRWAAREAGRRDTTLRLLHACVCEDTPADGHDELLLEHVHRRLRHAAGIVRDWAPGVRVEMAVRLGLATDLLLEEAAGAAVVVLGSRGLGGLRGALIGSVALRVAAAAPCPVVVVPAHQPVRTGPVVAGIDRSGSSEHALRFAFEEAAATRAPVLVVHAGDDDAELADHVAGRRRRYPDLEVRTQVVPERVPARALQHAAPDARLIVIGTRGRGPVAGGILGSTGNALLAHAACPVAVVH